MHTSSVENADELVASSTQVGAAWAVGSVGEVEWNWCRSESGWLASSQTRNASRGLPGRELRLLERAPSDIRSFVPVIMPATSTFKASILLLQADFSVQGTRLTGRVWRSISRLLNYQVRYVTMHMWWLAGADTNPHLVQKVRCSSAIFTLSSFR